MSIENSSCTKPLERVSFGVFAPLARIGVVAEDHCPVLLRPFHPFSSISFQCFVSVSNVLENRWLLPLVMDLESWKSRSECSYSITKIPFGADC